MAKSEEEAASQLDIENQINKVLKQRATMLQNQAKYLSAQTQLAMELCSALECKSLDGMKERLEEIQQGLSDAADKAKELEGGAQLAGGSLEKMAKGAAKEGAALSKIFSPWAGMFIGLGVGARNAFKSIGNSISSIAETAMSLGSIIVKISGALFSMPLDFLNGLTEASKQNAEAMQAFRQAVEDVRKQFGNLAYGEGKAVMDGFSNMQGQLAAVGVDAGSVFGWGPEGMAAMLKEVNEQVTDLGDSMNVFKDEVAKNAGEFAVYRKGLGLTGEAFRAMGTMAQTTGKTLEETLGEVANQALQMGTKFGVSSKEVAKTMADMAGDVANFGGMGTKELAAMAVYTKKLGINAKELQAVIAKWDNFEDAAVGASKLSQAFGMNIDAMEMMKEQNPAKRMDMLRDSFRATGKSVEDLSRQELKLLSAQMGLSEEAAKKALTSDVDYDEIAAASEEAEDSAITQAKAMKELAKSIEKLTNNPKFGSFMEALSSGFAAGIMQGEGMQELMRDIQASMREAYHFAKQLGKAFIDMFPGIDQMIRGLRVFFNPARFKALGNELLRTFKELFISLRSDPKAGVEKFMSSITMAFGNFFNPGGKGAGGAFLDGLKEFGKTAIIAIMSLIPVLMDKLAEMVSKLAKFLANPSELLKSAEQGGDGFAKAFISALENIKNAWPKLREALGELWEAAKPHLEKLWEEIGPWVFKYILLKLAAGIVMDTARGAITGLVSQGFKDLFTGSMEQGAKSAFATGAKNLAGTAKSGLGKAFSGMQNFLGPSITKVLGPIAAVTAIADAAINIGSAINEFGSTLREKGFDPATSTVAAGATGLINTLTLGLLPKDLQANIAESIATIYDTVMKSVDNFFGPGFSDSIKKQFAGLFNFFGGFGDLLVSMWNGNEAGVDKAFGQMFDGLVSMLTGNLETLGSAIFKGIPAILGYISKAWYGIQAYITDRIGNIFLSLKNIPVVGGLFEMIGDGFKGLSEMFRTAADSLNDVIGWIKNVDLGATFSSWLDGIGNFISEASTSFKNWVSDISETFSPIFDSITKPLNDAWEWFKNLYSFDNAKKIVSSVVDGIVNAFSELTSKISPIFAGFTDSFKKIFKMSNSVPENQGVVGKGPEQAIKEMEKNNTVMQEAAGIAEKGPSTQAAGSISKSIDNAKLFASMLGPQGQLQGLIDSLSKVKISDADSKNIQRLTPVLEVLSKTFDFMQELQGIQGDVSKPDGSISSKINSSIVQLGKIKWHGDDGLAGVLKTISSGRWDYNIDILRSRISAVEAMGKFLDAYRDVYSSMSSIINLPLDAHAKFVDRLTYIKSDLGSISGFAMGDLTTQVENAVKVVTELAKNYQQIQDLLSATNPVDITAKLNKFGETMAISTEKIQIENKPINIQVNLSITMDADEIAYGLSDTRRPTGKNTLTLSRVGGAPT